ncbi:DUF5518 domain-containing protein [Haladaptatus sp. W1]|uniref:DUF5518 domain-containing protein n=1 Tax=Haladaptatus sp. W1 TaxID=1897478 RepID=UPI00158676C0|nr:DUF5518 domain-containing protein [Haladaptatus sp. W1]
MESSTHRIRDRVRLGLLIVWLVPLTQLTTLVYAIPGLMGGVVAGYMVVGAGRGAIHGGLATIIGSVVLLIVWAIFGVLFAGLVPAIVGFSFGLFILLLAAIPGAIAGRWRMGERSPHHDS